MAKPTEKQKAELRAAKAAWEREYGSIGFQMPSADALRRWWREAKDNDWKPSGQIRREARNAENARGRSMWEDIRKEQQAAKSKPATPKSTAKGKSGLSGRALYEANSKKALQDSGYNSMMARFREDPEAQLMGGLSENYVSEDTVNGYIVQKYPQYFVGDEVKQLSALPREERIKLQRRMLRAGLVDSITEGAWGGKELETLGMLMARANLNGTDWQQQLAIEEASGKAAQKFQRRKYMRRAYEVPDVKELETDVLDVFRSKLGRDATDDELAALSERLADSYRVRAQQLEEIDRVNFELGQDQEAQAFTAETGIDAPLSGLQGGARTVTDPNAAFKQAFNERYGKEEKYVRQADETFDALTNLQDSFASVDWVSAG